MSDYQSLNVIDVHVCDEVPGRGILLRKIQFQYA